jgi:FkbM family methyltransferase
MRNEVIGDLVAAGFKPSVIFDVGANVGQSLAEFARAFPGAHIYSFEPIEATFAQLRRRAVAHRNAEAHCVALSSANREVVMRAIGASLGNRIMAPQVAGDQSQLVTTETGLAVAARLGVDNIDVLKIDTEGHDLEVVRGFNDMILRKRIQFIQVECGFAPENDRHVRFELFTDYLFPLGYRLFGIYGQRRRFGNSDTRNLMFGDAVFIAMP